VEKTDDPQITNRRVWWNMSMRHGTTFGEEDQKSSDAGILKEMYEVHAEETISDEQARRVLKPVLAMIDEGKFDKPRRIISIAPLATVAAVLVVAVTATLMLFSQPDNPGIEILESNPPLTDSIPARTVLPGSVTLSGKGVSGVTIILEDAYSLESVITVVTDNSGDFEFPEGVQPGLYKLIVIPPDGMEIINVTDSDGGIVVGETAHLIISDSGEYSWESVDIRMR